MSIKSSERLHLVDEANEVFGKIRKAAEKTIQGGAKTVDLIEVCNGAGLKIDENSLERLGLAREWIAHPFVDFSEWFPWRPLWSYYWSLKAPGSVAARAFLTDSHLRIAGAAFPAMVCP